MLADLDKRERDSAEFIRPQRRWADIVVRFAPIEERGEAERDGDGGGHLGLYGGVAMGLARDIDERRGA